MGERKFGPSVNNISSIRLKISPPFELFDVLLPMNFVFYNILHCMNLINPKGVDPVEKW